VPSARLIAGPARQVFPARRDRPGTQASPARQARQATRGLASPGRPATQALPVGLPVRQVILEPQEVAAPKVRPAPQASPGLLAIRHIPGSPALAVPLVRKVSAERLARRGPEARQVIQACPGSRHILASPERQACPESG